MFIQIACVAVLIPALGAALYLVLLALTSLTTRARRPATTAAAAHSFAILIPAHNEQAALPATLRACDALDYPSSQYRVFVIADNCSDGTADVALQRGATCLRRYDSERRGKGQALAWALPGILEQGFDAVLVLDADCTIERDALRAFDRHLLEGNRVLQAKVVAANPDESPVSCAVAVGNLLENDLFYAPKDRLGWAVFLRGTGMVLHRDVLERHPFQTCSEVEDAEYTVSLLRAGQPVRFVEEVCVRTAFPADLDQLRNQRLRWAAGSFHFAKVRALQMIASGLYRGRWRLADAGWTLLVASRPLVVLQLLLTLALAGLCCWNEPGPLSDFLGGSAAVAVLGHALYGLLGVCCLGPTRHRLALLWRAPLIGVCLVGIFLAGVIRPSACGWLPRSNPATTSRPRSRLAWARAIF